MASYTETKNDTGVTVENVAGIYEDWTAENSPDKSLSVSDVCVSSCAIQTDFGLVSDFGFAIPQGSTIDGIVVSLNCVYSSSSNDLDVKLSNSGGSGKTSYSSTKSSSSVTNGTNTFGSATDKWGTTWQASYINSSDFGAAFQASVQGDAYNYPSIELNTFSIIIYYTTVFGYDGTTEIKYVYNGSTQIKKIYDGTTFIHEFPTRS